MTLGTLRVACSALAAASLPIAGFAAAQDYRFPEEESAIGTRFMKQPENAGRDEARELQKRVARCSVYLNKELSRDLLANSDPVRIDFAGFDADPGTLMDDLDIGECIGRAMKHSTYQMQMRFQYATLRALIAEEVYLMDNDRPLTLPSDSSEFIEARKGARSLHPRAEGIAKLADCIVYNGTTQSDALLRSTIASKDEDAAIEALYPALMKCGLGGEKEVALDYSMLRQVVADGLWSRSYYTGDQSSQMGSQ